MAGVPRLRLIVVIAVGLAGALCGRSVSAAPAQGGPDIETVRTALYDYDASAPLEATIGPAPVVKNEPAKLKALRTRHLVTFTSVNDQRVPCILSLPKGGKKPLPAVILLAGSGGHKDTDYVRIAADMLCTLGMAALSVDAQYHGDRARKHRSGDIHFIQSPTNRDAWIQTVRDLRRAVDYLSARQDIDKDRIGFLGFSQGAMIGGTFIGVEPRLRAACLAVPGGDFLSWAEKLGVVPDQARGRLEVAASLTDPIHFIGRYAPKPLLILAARKDELIPAEATEALVNAAREPKQLIWYNSGHVLPPNALVVDARSFFEKHLGKR